MKKGALIGYAACACDVYRAGGQDYAEEAIKQTGVSLAGFIAAGIEEYDLEILRKIMEVE